MSETRIVSFVLRFMEEDALAKPAWRGVVRHVQSRDEIRFTRMEDALAFMERYVSLAPPSAAPEAQSCFARLNGLRLHYLDYGGDGPPLLFLPGLTANGRMAEGLVAAGLTEQVRLLALDWRGRGLSEKPAQGYSMGDHAADVIALLDELGLEQVALAGHSFGGLIAFYLAARYPQRVSRLVILDASPLLISERTLGMVQSILDRLGQKLPSLEAYLKAARQAPYLVGEWDEALERYYRSDVQVNADGTVQALARPEAIAETIKMEYVEPWAEHMAAIAQPVLLLNACAPFGAADAAPILPPEMARQTVASLARAEYWETPGNHITMIFGKNAVPVVRAITRFLGNDERAMQADGPSAYSGEEDSSV